ncbi:MAG: NAD(P)-dependent oxidoreductase [Candidatus Diapherotrites archaeon]|uniref:NAD(P)-dependent oxidoreductase n=1 Tax=Candidatus Iainarchaeum sp. TaxID=3101447 RepID=A0A8T4KPX2_9ARCH|nr:NAD(P)-dependent oxidoreductase [Candidatus Diapherotrites archaeon]
MDRILVTGGAGYIGSILTKQLLEQGYKVRVLDCLFFGDSGIKQFRNNENFELINGRIENPEVVENAVKGCSAVLHLAGLANDASCDISEEKTRLINYEGTKLLLKYAKSAGVQRFIYGSSASIYGAGKNTALTESSPLAPVSLYAKYRIKCEEALFDSASNDFTVCALRKSTVFGYSPRQRLDLVINAMSAHAFNRHEITQMGGSQWRPNLHVSDAANAYIACLKANPDAVQKQAFNVGANSENYTVAQIAQMIVNEFPNTKIVHKEVSNSASYNLNFDKIESALNYKAKVSVKQGIAELKEALNSNLISNYENDIYYNAKRMLDLQKEGAF